MRITIESSLFNSQTDIKPRQDLMSCLFTGVLSALPAFLEAFMTCLAGAGETGGYQPGNRPRCEPPR